VLDARIVVRQGVDQHLAVARRRSRSDDKGVHGVGIADDRQHVAAARTAAVDVDGRHRRRQRQVDRESVVAFQPVQRVPFDPVRLDQQATVQGDRTNQGRGPANTELVAGRRAHHDQHVRPALRRRPQRQRGAQAQILVADRQRFVDADRPFVAACSRRVDDDVIRRRIQHRQPVVARFAVVYQRLEAAFARRVVVLLVAVAVHHKAVNQVNDRVIRAAQVRRGVDAQRARFRSQRLIHHAGRTRRF